ncbi:protein wings apart-like [Scaptodrosophila lebanonensis]|uniref:Protein wings apart-like n=1 Tax=Drosophila lebanonensis TaxID=7225 RepID=A0A6J2TTQ7_DROLE|nr:protein wings apart-like [Scaptodrosophila lebanonensis]
MSRWGKNIVVPLDSLCKEKENTNRPTVARSVGTVGKWGKMGFTSTRTYTLSALHPMAAAAAAAAAAASPAQSPASTHEHDPHDLSVSVPEPPKPKKFFKSRNAAPPEVIAQIIQQLPHCVATSPTRDHGAGMTGSATTPTQEHGNHKSTGGGKGNSAERKRKSPKKKKANLAAVATPGALKELADGLDTSASPAVEPKGKKKKLKEEKKLKPEAPPSRILGRARKAVNYCEVDDDERYPTPVKDLIIPKAAAVELDINNSTAEAEAVTTSEAATVATLPPPISVPAAATTTTVPVPSASSSASRTPEHPPIVLRISKGTSRLVSTDSEEPPNASPAEQQHQQQQQQPHDFEAPDASEAYDVEVKVPAPSTPKIIVKPPRPPPAIEASTTNNNNNNDDDEEEEEEEEEDEEEEPPEINYCTVKISPDKPPKERLKLIIKTDVIRNAIAKAAAEKKSKSKKHKHPKHAALEQLLPAPAATTTAPGVATTTAAHVSASEFKTPSPHLALSTDQVQHPHALPHHHRGHVISPTTRSEHDFDSQSSVLGSISSKGNSTPQLLAQAVQEDSCVIRSRGSSVITSDLETSQHSSLVAPPSDIESRLESMMMTIDGATNVGNEAHTRVPIAEEPLQEDILAVLRGEVATATLNGDASDKEPEAEGQQPKRSTRGRPRRAVPTAAAVQSTDVAVAIAAPAAEPSPPPATTTRTRGRGKPATAIPEPVTPSGKRATRGRAKKVESESNMDVGETTPDKNTALAMLDNEAEQQTTTTVVAAPRRGRPPRANNNAASSTNTNNNNNNISKIAANLAGKAEAGKSNDLGTQRSYGRKRKNPQVTHLEPESDPTPEDDMAMDMDADSQPTPAKMPHNLPLDALTDDLSNNSNNSSLQHDGSTSSPPPRDYKFKDKFKRTLTLDTQVANQANAAAAAAAAAAAGTAEEAVDSGEVPAAEQRGAVKLVISKKKGSIFKSRTLVRSDQAQPATVAKRHLYKHSWDAALEANGAGTGSDASNASPSTTSGGGVKADALVAGKSAADAIYADFGDSSSNNNTSSGSGGGSLRGESPSMGKLTRGAKPNAQSAPTNASGGNHFDLDDALSGGGGGGGVASGGVGVGGSGSGGSLSNAESSVTSVRVDRKTKEYYTVVRNVKTAHQIQEIGEYQEMDDDVEYILDALQPHNPLPTRCLSALQLATKCMTPSFRMHVRAHGVVTKFFKALSDANKDLSLGLCTSAIMYILSQEGLNMDLDRDSLELMINLLEAEGISAPSDHANYERNKQKVRELCEEIKAQGKGTHLNVESITVGTLAMETLLSLTSKRAGEWFKEDLRKLGGLEHIIKTISDFCQPIIERSNVAAGITWHQSLLDNMQTVARCLRVLENVTQHNETNQRYMLTFANGRAVDTLCMLYRLCDRQLVLHPTTEAGGNGKGQGVGVAMRELLIPVMKVLINLTHTFNEAQPSLGAELLGRRSDVIETSFHLLLLASNLIPDRCVFELSILVLTLLINLSMHTLPNRAALMQAYAPPEYIADHPPQNDQSVTAIQALLEYFYKCEELAKLVEKNTDAFLENNEKSKKKQEEVEETVNNLVQRAGHHMEHTLKGSYAAILIGNLITDNEEYENVLRRQLRGNSFKEIIGVLEKYHTFMSLTSSLEAAFVAHMKSTKKIIDNFKKRDYIYEHSDEHTMPLNLETTHHHQISSTTSSTSGNVPPTEAGSSSPPNSATATTTARSSNMPRVYKTYSNHR